MPCLLLFVLFSECIKFSHILLSVLGQIKLFMDFTLTFLLPVPTAFEIQFPVSPWCSRLPAHSPTRLVPIFSHLVQFGMHDHILILRTLPGLFFLCQTLSFMFFFLLLTLQISQPECDYAESFHASSDLLSEG